MESEKGALIYSREELFEQYKKFPSAVVTTKFNHILSHELLRDSEIDFESLVSESNCTLINSINRIVTDRYKFNSDKAISTYLWKSIEGRLKDYIAEQSGHGLTGIHRKKFWRILSDTQTIKKHKDLQDYVFVKDQCKTLSMSSPLDTGEEEPCAMEETIPADQPNVDELCIRKQHREVMGQALIKAKAYYSEQPEYLKILRDSILKDKPVTVLSEELKIGQSGISRARARILYTIKRFAKEIKPGLTFPERINVDVRDLTSGYPEYINIKNKCFLIDRVIEVSDSGGSFNVIQCGREIE